MKANVFDILDKHECLKENCVKSVLGEFSSGVSTCRNKSTQSDLRPPVCPGGQTGSYSSSFVCTRNVHRIGSGVQSTGSAKSFRIVIVSQNFWRNQIWIVLKMFYVFRMLLFVNLHFESELD